MRQTIKIRRLTTLLFALAILLFCGGASAAKADPLVLTGGSVTFGDDGKQQDAFTLLGNGFLFSGRLSTAGEGRPGLHEFLLGAQLPYGLVNQTTGNDDFRINTPIIINGVPYSSNYLRGGLFFTGANFTVPVNDDLDYVTLTAPFTLTGNVSGYGCDPNNDESCPVIFSAGFNGQGTMTVQLTNVRLINKNLPPGYYVTSLTYDIAAVPEPSTIVLLGTGLAAVTIGAYLRRKRRTPK